MSQRKRIVSALLSDDEDNNEELTTIRPQRKSRAVAKILEKSEGLTSNTSSHDRRIVHCSCSKCNGNFVDVRTKMLHENGEDLNQEDSNVQYSDFIQDSDVIQEDNNPLPSLEDDSISLDENSEDTDDNNETIIQ